MGIGFEPIRTQRLLLRPVRSSDASALVSRRNHPEVAALQDWPMPYTEMAAAQTIASLEAMNALPDDKWWMLSIANTKDELDRNVWGQGYATEALNGLVDWLFDVRCVTRVAASLHPYNLRSAKVLERCGFAFEGHTRNSFWAGDENSDDWLYGLTPTLRNNWNSRPTHRPKSVTLVEPQPSGLRHILSLEPHQSQKHFVAPIATSLAQVAVPPFEQGDSTTDQLRVNPWPRIIYADDEPVGFVMLERPTKTNPVPFLWRLFIDRLHQRRGIGWQVLDLVADQARNWGCDALLVSWVEGYGSPAPMYLRFGFEATGEVEDGETVGRLRLL